MIEAIAATLVRNLSPTVARSASAKGPPASTSRMQSSWAMRSIVLSRTARTRRGTRAAANQRELADRVTCSENPDRQACLVGQDLQTSGFDDVERITVITSAEQPCAGPERDDGARCPQLGKGRSIEARQQRHLRLGIELVLPTHDSHRPSPLREVIAPLLPRGDS